LTGSANAQVAGMPKMCIDDFALACSSGRFNRKGVCDLIEPGINIECVERNLCQRSGDGSSTPTWTAVGECAVVLIDSNLNLFLAIQDRDEDRCQVAIDADPAPRKKLLGPSA